MRARTLILPLLAVMIAGGTALLARSWLASREAELKAAPVPLAALSKSVMVARADIRRGQILRPEDLVWQVWPEGGIDKNYVVLGGPKKPDSFTGWVAKNPIGGGEPITEGRIIAPGNRGFLAAVLRPGMRALSVPVTVTSGISGFIFPGDQVDLLLTYSVPSLAPAGEGAQSYNHKAAETVLHNIRVIAIDQRLESKAGEAVPAHTATFEVSPKQSEVIALASEIGKMSLSLRSLVASPGEAPATEGAVAASVGRNSPGSSGQDSPDSSVAASATFTLDDEISPLLPKLRGGVKTRPEVAKAPPEVAVVTILRGGGKGIAITLAVGGSTVYRTKRRFVEGNLEAALSEEPRLGAERKLSGKEEALLVATACSNPPEGRARWTLELLAGAMVALTEHEDLSRETVRRRLAENHLKPWRKDMWCIPQIDGTYVARMEDVLDLYAEAPDPRRPVVCFDESPTQLIGEARQPIPAAPGQLERYDCEYRRNGTVNLFVFLDAHRPWRKVKVTDHRTGRDFAHCMRELADVHYPQAEQIRVVLDNLSTHSAGALYEAFPAPEARRLLRRLEFHYTPKHASWLNMVEIEIGVLRGQCLDRRIGERDRLIAEIAAWERQRNASGARVKWMFTTERARAKLGRAYPDIAKES